MLTPPGADDLHRVAALVAGADGDLGLPPGFAAYTRLLHPAWAEAGDAGAEEPVRWRAVLARLGRRDEVLGEPRLLWEDVVGAVPAGAEPLAGLVPPQAGPPEPAVLGPLLDHLRGRTGDCLAAYWTGAAFARTDLTAPDLADGEGSLEVDDERYAVTVLSLDDVAAGAAGTPTEPGRRPVWHQPEWLLARDGSWGVWADRDLPWCLVGGDDALAAALRGDARLEAVAVGPPSGATPPEEPAAGPASGRVVRVLRIPSAP